MMRRPTPAYHEQVEAMRRWAAERADVLDYVVVAPHDETGAQMLGTRATVVSNAALRRSI